MIKKNEIILKEFKKEIESFYFSLILYDKIIHYKNQKVFIGFQPALIIILDSLVCNSLISLRRIFDKNDKKSFSIKYIFKFINIDNELKTSSEIFKYFNKEKTKILKMFDENYKFSLISKLIAHKDKDTIGYLDLIKYNIQIDDLKRISMFLIDLYYYIHEFYKINYDKNEDLFSSINLYLDHNLNFLFENK